MKKWMLAMVAAIGVSAVGATEAKAQYGRGWNGGGSSFSLNIGRGGFGGSGFGIGYSNFNSGFNNFNRGGFNNFYGGGYYPRPYYGGGYYPRPYYGGGYGRPYYGGYYGRPYYGW